MNYSQQLPQNYNQLQIPFNDCVAVLPFNYDLVEPDKLYVISNMARFPFFLITDSKVVNNSRKGYKQLVKGRKLKAKGVDYKSIIQQTKYSVSPFDNIVQFSDDAVLLENESSLKPSELTYNSGIWSILSHPNWGLLNEIDGWYWDYILNLISSIYQSNKTFYYVYYINYADMIRYRLLNSGLKLPKVISGSYYIECHDSIQRLMNTTFVHKKGHYLSSENAHLPSHEYNFRLISSLYSKGDKLPDNSIAYSAAIALDPLIILNFKNNSFLICLNFYRAKLNKLLLKSLFDRLTYLVFHALRHQDFMFCGKFNIPYFITFSYQNLCSFLGFNLLSNLERQPSKIYRQFNVYFKGLIDAEIINEVLVDKHNNKINIVFIFNPEFVFKASDISNEFSLLKNVDKQNFSTDQIVFFAKKLTSFINSDVIRKKLFGNALFKQK